MAEPTLPAEGQSKEVYFGDTQPVEVESLADGIEVTVSDKLASEVVVELRRIRIGLNLLLLRLGAEVDLTREA